MIEFMVFLGFLTHHISILIDLKIVKKKKVNLITWYIKKRPLKLLLSVIGSVAGYVVLDDLGYLNAATALTIGYLSDSIVDKIGKITAGRIK